MALFLPPRLGSQPGGIGRLFASLIFLFGFRPLLGTLSALFQPRRHPIRRVCGFEQPGLHSIQQEQPQRMLAGKFSAWAGTVERWLAQVDLCPVGLFCAALAFAPNGALIRI
jgi:hypothetical protein